VIVAVRMILVGGSDSACVNPTATGRGAVVLKQGK